MNRATPILLLTVILSFAGACQKQEAKPAAAAGSVAARTTPGDLTPEQLGALGAQIRKEPSRADEFLTQHHLTRQQFEKAIRDVTEDAEASKRYAEAYRRASA